MPLIQDPDEMIRVYRQYIEDPLRRGTIELETERLLYSRPPMMFVHRDSMIPQVYQELSLQAKRPMSESEHTDTGFRRMKQLVLRLLRKRSADNSER